VHRFTVYNFFTVSFSVKRFMYVNKEIPFHLNCIATVVYSMKDKNATDFGAIHNSYCRCTVDKVSYCNSDKYEQIFKIRLRSNSQGNLKCKSVIFLRLYCRLQFTVRKVMLSISHLDCHKYQLNTKNSPDTSRMINNSQRDMGIPVV